MILSAETARKSAPRTARSPSAAERKGPNPCPASRAVRRRSEGEERPAPGVRHGGLQTMASNSGGPSGQGTSVSWLRAASRFFLSATSPHKTLYRARPSRPALMRAASAKISSRSTATTRRVSWRRSRARPMTPHPAPRSATFSSPFSAERAKSARCRASALKRKDASGWNRPEGKRARASELVNVMVVYNVAGEEFLTYSALPCGASWQTELSAGELFR